MQVQGAFAPGGAQSRPLSSPTSRPYRPTSGTRTSVEPNRSGAALAKPPVRKLAKDLGVDLTR